MLISLQLQNEDYNSNLDQAYLYIERDIERNLNLALTVSTINEMKEIILDAIKF